MKISKQLEISLLVLYELAKAPQNRIISASEISREYNISEYYIKKIFRFLSLSGFLISREGKKGGYKLSVPESQITVWDVITRMSNKAAPINLNNITHKCPLSRKCPLHKIHSELENNFKKTFHNVKLSDLVN